MLAVLDMIERENQRYIDIGREKGIKEGRKEGKKEGKIYNIPINVDTIKEGYPILCA